MDPEARPEPAFAGRIVEAVSCQPSWSNVSVVTVLIEMLLATLSKSFSVAAFGTVPLRASALNLHVIVVLFSADDDVSMTWTSPVVPLVHLRARSSPGSTASFSPSAGQVGDVIVISDPPFNVFSNAGTSAPSALMVTLV